MLVPSPRAIPNVNEMARAKLAHHALRVQVALRQLAADESQCAEAEVAGEATGDGRNDSSADGTPANSGTFTNPGIRQDTPQTPLSETLKTGPGDIREPENGSTGSRLNSVYTTAVEYQATQSDSDEDSETEEDTSDDVSNFEGTAEYQKYMNDNGFLTGLASHDMKLGCCDQDPFFAALTAETEMEASRCGYRRPRSFTLLDEDYRLLPEILEWPHKGFASLPDTEKNTLFKQVADIPLVQVVRAWLKACGNHLDAPCNWALESMHAGTYNCAYIVAHKHFENLKFVVRVPRNGYRMLPADLKSWQSQKATAEILQNLRIPAPRIYFQTTSMDTEFGWPFQIVEFARGVPLYTVLDREECDWEMKYNIFRSLARVLQPLHDYGHRHSGMFMETAPGRYEVVDAVQISEPCARRDQPARRTAARVEKYYSVCENVWARYCAVFEKDEYDNTLTDHHRGACYAFRAILTTLLGQVSRAGHDFVIGLPDFDVQNVLIDPDTLQITGILDLDGAQVVPFYRGVVAGLLKTRKYWRTSYNAWKRGVEEDDQDWQDRQIWVMALREVWGPHSDAYFATRAHILYEIEEVLDCPFVLEEFVRRFLAKLLDRTLNEASDVMAFLGCAVRRQIPETAAWVYESIRVQLQYDIDYRVSRL